MLTTLGGLEVRVMQQTQGPARAAVILCHGFGAPADDLVTLWNELVSREPSLADVRFFFPAGVLSMGNLGWGQARAWWLIDLPTVARLQAGDPSSLREFRRVEPDGMPAARQAVRALVSEVCLKSDLPVGRVIVGGFSQGAMIATDVALRLEEAPLGLVVLSGTLLLEDVWATKAKARAGLPVFQSHGRGDPILAFGAAQWLRELFEAQGMPVTFNPFDGGHTIDESTVTGLGRYLVQRLETLSAR
ncbi:MAG: phospholipase [Archangium sp.]|nr:phospholipase [Archangium sp.]